MTYIDAAPKVFGRIRVHLGERGTHNHSHSAILARSREDLAGRGGGAGDIEGAHRLPHAVFRVGIGQLTSMAPGSPGSRWPLQRRGGRFVDSRKVADPHLPCDT